MSTASIPCYVVAEIGCNHLGRIDVALAMVDAAAEAGADAAKFQVFRTEELYVESDPEFEKLKREELGFEDFREIHEHCTKTGIDFLATPFDEGCIDFLDSLGVEVFKVGSGELNHTRFLKHLAAKGKKVILSTGMASIEEISTATKIFVDAGCELVLLHCISAYPAELGDANITTIADLHNRFGLPVGYSDHCLLPYAAYGAVALGACIVEKHVTLSRSLPGDDHPMSLEFPEFKELVQGIRAVESSMGRPRSSILTAETATISLSRRSPYARRDIPEGSVMTIDDVLVRRPPHALGADQMPILLGRRVKKSIGEGQPLTLDMFE